MAELTDEEIAQWREDRAAQADALAKLLARVEAMETLPKGVTAEQVTAAITEIKAELATLKTEAPTAAATAQIAAMQTTLAELQAAIKALPPSSKGNEGDPPAPPPANPPKPPAEVKPTRADKHGWL